MVLLDQKAQLLSPKKLPLAVARLCDSVGVKNQNIAGLERHAPFVVAHFFKNPKGKSRERDLVATPVFIKQRLRLSRVRDAQLAPAPLPGREARRHEAPLDAPFANNLIHLLKHLRGLQFLRSETPHDADGHRAVKRRRGSLSAYVAERNPKLLRPVAQEFVQVSAHFSSGEVSRRHVQPEILGRHGPQKCSLYALRRLQIAFETRLVARHLLVQSRIFQRYGKVGGKNR